MAILDRFRAMYTRLVLDILAEQGAPPFWRLVPARVSSVAADLKTVSVIFEDPTGVLKSKGKVKLLCGVGESVKLAKGSKVLVGWMAADERYSFALYGGWIENGGLEDFNVTFSGKYNVKGNKIGLGGDFDTTGPESLDAVATKQDLLNLLYAMNQSSSAGAGSMAALVALLQTPAYKWVLGGTPPLPGLGSTVVKAKR